MCNLNCKLPLYFLIVFPCFFIKSDLDWGEPLSVNIHFFSPQHPMSDKSISNLEDDHVIWDRHYTLKVRINTVKIIWTLIRRYNATGNSVDYVFTVKGTYRQCGSCFSLFWKTSTYAKSANASNTIVLLREFSKHVTPIAWKHTQVIKSTSLFPQRGRTKLTQRLMMQQFKI